MLNAEHVARIDRNPTEAQAEAGNYRKAHVRVHGLEVAVETPRGAYRRGIGPGGTPWKVRLPHHYGYIKRTEGADGDHVDCYLGPHMKSPLVFIVDQKNAETGDFDEHKCLIGFASPKQAKAAYLAGFSDGKGQKRFSHMTELTVAQFKDWLRDGDTTQELHRASGGRIPDFAAGGAPEFDPSKPFVPADAPAFDPTAPSKPASTAPAPEGGGWTSYLPKAITDVPHEMYEAGAEQVRNVGDAWTRIRERRAAQAAKDKAGGSFFDPKAFAGQASDVLDTGSAALSAVMAVPAAVVQGPARSLLGHPVADLETTIGGMINPKVAAERAKGAAYTDAKHSVDMAVGAARPKGHVVKAAPAYGPHQPPGKFEIPADAPAYTHPSRVPPPESPQALENQRAGDEFGIKYSRGQATENLDSIRYEDMAARGAYGPEAQERAAAFFDQQFKDIQAGGRQVSESVARGQPAVEAPAEAAAAANTDVAARAAQARQMRDTAQTTATREAEAQHAMAADRERAIADAVAAGRPHIEAPRDAAELVGTDVRAAAQRDRGEFRSRYDEAFSLPGHFEREAFQGTGNRMRERMTYADDPVIIDDVTTPVANRALADIDRHISEFRVPNRAQPRGAPDDPANPAETVSINLKGVDQARKRLVAFYKAARGNNSDQRAMSRILHEFDTEVENAMTSGLFSGDPRAVEALREARASFARYQRTYRPREAGDDVGTAMRRIVDRNATPEEIANMVIGSGKVGSAGLPVRLADRLEEVLGTGSQSWNAIRQAMWQRASQVRNSTGATDPVRSAASVIEFTNSTLARRMFSPQERSAMRAHGQGVRDLERTIEGLPQTQAAERARSIYQQAFGGEGLGGAPAAAFRKIIDGTATPEETTQALFNVIGGSNPGHVVRTIDAIERIVGRGSETMGAVRQGIWQKLTQNPMGKDQPGQQKTVQAIGEFLNGKGRTIAQRLYSPEELALMDRYASAVRKTIIPKYARTNSDTAPALLAAVRKYAGMIGSALGLGVHGGLDGGLSGYAVGALLDKAGGKIGQVANANKLSKSLENFVPTQPKQLPPPRLRSAKTLPLAVRGGPNLHPAPQLTGPGPSRAEEDKKRP